MMKSALFYVLTACIAGTGIAGCSRLDQNWAAKKLVERQLKDPNSAQFTEVVNGPEATCGYVNSKNDFGAYSGRLAFVVVGNDLTFDDQEMDFRTLVRKRCAHDFAFPFAMEVSEQANKKINSDIEDLRRSGAIK